MGWDRRPSVPGAVPTLPSLANITRASPGSIKSPSQNGNSPPLSQQSGDLRDSGNWSMNSARASNSNSPWIFFKKFFIILFFPAFPYPHCPGPRWLLVAVACVRE